MDLDLLFRVCSTMVLPGWLLLAVAPRWRHTQTIAGWVLPALMAAVYAAVLLPHFGATQGDFNSLNGVLTLFRDPRAVLAGWVHYLSFDLFIGAWEVREAQRRGVPHWVVVPCLALTLMLGPCGLLLFLAARGVWRRRET